VAEHPPEKSDFDTAADNEDPNAPPDQHGTTSQGWTERDTARREKFQQLHDTPDDEFEDPDQHPTAPQE
jgi:hypothetical protein